MLSERQVTIRATRVFGLVDLGVKLPVMVCRSWDRQHGLNHDPERVEVSQQD